MVRFRRLEIRRLRNLKEIYIPIWLDFDRNRYVLFCQYHSNLHSNMVRFRLSACNLVPDVITIYIPIWLDFDPGTN